MKSVAPAAALMAALLISPAARAEPPAKMAPMNMGMMMAPMPSAYAGQADKPGAPVFVGLGRHRHRISTRNPATQKFFDQGVNLLFGFNHAEAIRSFREAARLDRACAMCWWGVAFALGPNINLPMPADAAAPAWQALAKARALEAHASPRERAWIEALSVRYAEHPAADRGALDEAFAQAMGRLWRDDPADLDAGVFYAEAMMDTQPWDYWQADGVTPKGHATDIVLTLEKVIAVAPDHPGALHLYIHAVEATTTPQRAEVAADRLLTLMPGAGHIVHMPSHIYYRVGRYADAVRVNEQAALVDEAYLSACKAQGYYPAGYYAHNIHFLWTSSEMEGRYGAALGAARRLVKAVDAQTLARTMPQAELYAFTPVATLLRFGKWREILAEPAPPESLTLDMAIWLEARGFAHANTGDQAAALADRAKLQAITGGDFSRFDGSGTPARQMAKLALALLDGEIARTSGRTEDALFYFRLAADQERALPYTEPPYWHQPVSHLLGAALIDAGRPGEAEAVYRDSLKTYRRDGWALAGLELALNRQGKTAEAKAIRLDVDSAWRFADVSLATSRF